eukprot:194832-Chlamydomonas_euryale.AAC.3
MAVGCSLFSLAVSLLVRTVVQGAGRVTAVWLSVWGDAATVRSSVQIYQRGLVRRRRSKVSEWEKARFDRRYTGVVIKDDPGLYREAPCSISGIVQRSIGKPGPPPLCHQRGYPTLYPAGGRGRNMIQTHRRDRSAARRATRCLRCAAGRDGRSCLRDEEGVPWA